MNVGAYVDDLRPKTKKALKEAIASGNVDVYFDSTSMYDETSGVALSNLENGQTLNVVGPDPYTQRNWYATVKKTADRILVS